MEDLLKLKREIELSLATLNKVMAANGVAFKPREGTPGIILAVGSSGKTTVAFENPNWFFETCHLLKVHPKAEPRDADVLESLPSGLNKYGSLTEGQWKLFKALHFKLLGSWPEPGSAAAPAHVVPMTDDELNNIPF